AGTLTLGGVNTFSGGVTLGAGTLNINNNSALGTGTFTINGGTFGNSSGGTVTVGNAHVWNSDITFAGPNNLTLTSGTTLTATRQVTVSGGTLAVNGVVGDGGNVFGLTKAGTGTLTLGGANTYTGATAINAGKLLVNGSPANGAANVNGGASLRGAGAGVTTGVLGSAVTVAVGPAGPTRATLE